jgi:hypothetical protein
MKVVQSCLACGGLGHLADRVQVPTGRKVWPTHTERVRCPNAPAEDVSRDKTVRRPEIPDNVDRESAEYLIRYGCDPRDARKKRP